MRAAAMRAWAWLTWLKSPLVTRKRLERNARSAFELGVDAGAFGLVRPSRAPDVKHLSGLPTDVVGVEIPPRCGADYSPLLLAPLSERGVFQQTARADRMIGESSPAMVHGHLALPATMPSWLGSSGPGWVRTPRTSASAPTDVVRTNWKTGAPVFQSWTPEVPGS